MGTEEQRGGRPDVGVHQGNAELVEKGDAQSNAGKFRTGWVISKRGMTKEEKKKKKKEKNKQTQKKKPPLPPKTPLLEKPKFAGCC